VDLLTTGQGRFCFLFVDGWYVQENSKPPAALFLKKKSKRKVKAARAITGIKIHYHEGVSYSHSISPLNADSNSPEVFLSFYGPTGSDGDSWAVVVPRALRDAEGDGGGYSGGDSDRGGGQRSRKRSRLASKR
jgi:hypothetical protein